MLFPNIIIIFVGNSGYIYVNKEWEGVGVNFISDVNGR
jgi:hypothetical protein